MTAARDAKKTAPAVYAVYAAFGGPARIVAEYRPRSGWNTCRGREYASIGYVRLLHQQGVTVASLVPVADPHRPPTDFLIDELVNKENES